MKELVEEELTKVPCVIIAGSGVSGVKEGWEWMKGQVWKWGQVGNWGRYMLQTWTKESFSKNDRRKHCHFQEVHKSENVSTTCGGLIRC